jgi:hypothetical protein
VFRWPTVGKRIENMRIRAIQWAAVNASLNLARSPFDAAIADVRRGLYGESALDV